jgi:hypothetical protein
MTTMQAKITGSNVKKGVMYYNIQVTSESSNWTVARRYTEFGAVRKELSEDCKGSLPFPPKKLTGLSKRDAWRREASLQQFLDTVMGLPAPFFSHSTRETVKQFLTANPIKPETKKKNALFGGGHIRVTSGGVTAPVPAPVPASSNAGADVLTSSPPTSAPGIQ